MKRLIIILYLLINLYCFALGEENKSSFPFSGSVENPAFLGLSPGLSTEAGIPILTDIGFSIDQAKVTEYNNSGNESRYQWLNNRELCAVTLYITNGQINRMGLMYSIDKNNSELENTIQELYTNLCHIYGKSDAPLSLPETWPEFALKDIPMALWSRDAFPAVQLVYRVLPAGGIHPVAIIQFEAFIN